MASVIQFSNVSKRYKLGMTRTSLPTVISQWARMSFTKPWNKPDVDQYLWAIKDVSFELKKGKSLALIGPNGAGKTTILKLLAQITRPTSGDINIKGKLSALIELGAGFHPDLSGRENIYLNGTILGLKKNEIKQRFDEIVAFSELERFIDTPVKRYSSGMTVRLGFAVAANIDPDILLVDEVLAVGDASFRQKCMERIKDLLDKGTSVIFVSHNLWLVQAVCDTALYIDAGRVIQEGSVTDVVDLYDQRLNLERAQKYAKETEIGEGNTSDIEIEAIEILEESSQISGDLHSDRPATVRVHYIAYRDFEALNLVIRILRSDGITCCAMRTSIDNFPVSLEHGKGIVSLTLDPLQLYGGTYYIQALIRDSGDAYGITSCSSDWFYVKGSMLSHQEMNGVFEPNRYWAQAKI